MAASCSACWLAQSVGSIGDIMQFRSRSAGFDSVAALVAETLRLAELIAALSLATDLGMGQPLEQALRTCLIALSIGERLKLSSEQLSEIYYVSLLRFLGCSADAHEAAQTAGGDEIALRAAIAPVLGGPPSEFVPGVMPQIGRGQGPLRRARLVAVMMRSGRSRAREGVRAHCELGENLAQRLGLAAGVRAGLAAAFEQWNGQGFPNGLAGDAIPLAARVVFLARDVEVLHRQLGLEGATARVRKRSGASYDPAAAEALLRHAGDVNVRRSIRRGTRSCGASPSRGRGCRRRSSTRF